MIVFLVRHADRPPTPHGGPVPDALSAPGQERARLLARMLSDSGVRLAYRSDTARTAQTLEPLKTAKDLPAGYWTLLSRSRL